MTARRSKLKKILLLGNDTRVMLAVSRSLGRSGHEVHVGWCPDSSPAVASRYVQTVHAIPEYSPDDEAWKTALGKIMGGHDFDLILPCNDPAVIPLQVHRADFETQARLYLLDDDVFQIVFDKIRTLELAKRLKIPLPISVVGSCRRTLLAECDRCRYPLFVKPRSSVTECDVINKRAVRRADTPEALASILQDKDIAEGVLVQESFEGIGVGVEVLACQGEVCAALQHKRLRESMAGGSTYRETVPLDPLLLEATGKMMRALNYTGVAMAEFRFDPRTKDWVFLEINARFWGSLPLAVAAGMDFPVYLVQMLLEGQREFNNQYRYGIRCRNLVEDLRGVKNEGSSRLAKIPRVVRELALVATGRDHLDMFATDDWRPQLKEVSALFQSQFRKWRERVFGASAPTREPREVLVRQ
ncbi:MAG: ATP-grasp domain-containing protein [Pirellulaceae bacterium]